MKPATFLKRCFLVKQVILLLMGKPATENQQKKKLYTISVSAVASCNFEHIVYCKLQITTLSVRERW